MKANSIDRVVVSKTNPHNNNALWIDTSNGEKNAVLKYKGNPLVGGGSGSDSGCDCGGFKYNELPEPVEFRDPIGEESNALKTFGCAGNVIKVLDLKDGIIPKEIILREYEDSPCQIYRLTDYSSDMSGGIYVDYCRSSSSDGIHDIAESFYGTEAIISKDGTLLGIMSSGIS